MKKLTMVLITLGGIAAFATIASSAEDLAAEAGHERSIRRSGWFGSRAPRREGMMRLHDFSGFATLAAILSADVAFSSELGYQLLMVGGFGDR